MLSALTVHLNGPESATWYGRARWTPSWLQRTYWSYRGSRRGVGALVGYVNTSAISHWHSNARGDAGPFRGHAWHNGFSLTLSVTVSYPTPNHCRPPGRPFCLAAYCDRSSGNTPICHFQTSGTSFNKTFPSYTEAVVVAAQRIPFLLCAQTECIYATSESPIKTDT